MNGQSQSQSQHRKLLMVGHEPVQALPLSLSQAPVFVSARPSLAVSTSCRTKACHTYSAAKITLLMGLPVQTATRKAAAPPLASARASAARRILGHMLVPAYEARRTLDDLFAPATEARRILGDTLAPAADAQTILG